MYPNSSGKNTYSNNCSHSSLCCSRIIHVTQTSALAHFQPHASSCHDYSYSTVCLFFFFLIIVGEYIMITAVLLFSNNKNQTSKLFKHLVLALVSCFSSYATCYMSTTWRAEKIKTHKNCWIQHYTIN